MVHGFHHTRLNLSDSLSQESASAEKFLEQLPQYDQELAKQRKEAEADGEVSMFCTSPKLETHQTN